MFDSYEIDCAEERRRKTRNILRFISKSEFRISFFDGYITKFPEQIASFRI